MRRLLPAYNFPVPEAAPGWMEQYRDSWGSDRSVLMGASPERGGEFAGSTVPGTRPFPWPRTRTTGRAPPRTITTPQALRVQPE